ncbi:hypothetical protein [Rhizobacter fulvus]
MSNMPKISDHDPAWLPLEEAKARGLAVALIEDMLCGDVNPPLRRTTAPATEAVLIAHIDEMMPGVLLADGLVVPLTWAQALALRDALTEFARMLDPKEHGKHGAPRASVVLAQ